MEFLVLVLATKACFISGIYAEIGNVKDFSTYLPSHLNLTDPSGNTTDTGKDMYVIRATVYQVGILTNRTDNMTDNFNSTGNQESVTLYHTNGTKVDLSAIPEPLLTNVTAQTFVGVAPITDHKGQNSLDAWGALDQLTHPAVSTDEILTARTKNSADYNDDILLRLFKRDATDTLRVVNGAAVIPPEAGIQSISLPPLLSFNNKLTEIPLPIPNTSIVHYAKVNTLIQKP